MKIQFNGKDLEKAIAAVNRAISGKLLNQILTGVLIDASGDKVRFTATNFEILIRCTVDADVVSPGRVLISGKLFHDLIRKMPGTDITISDGKKNRLSVQSGKAAYDILTMDVREYPELSPVQTENPIILKAEILREISRKVAFAAAEYTANSGVFSGVHFKITGDTLAVSATNKHRLARLVYPFQSDNQGDIVISPKIIAEIANLANPDDDIEMGWQAGKVVFKTDKVYLDSRVISGHFPDVTQVIPQDLPITVTVRREELLQAIDRVSLISIERLKDVVLNDIEMTVTPGVLFIGASTAQKGAAKEELPIKLQGEGIDILLNGNQIMDFLKAVDADEVVFSFKSPRGAATITAVGDNQLVYVITPIVRRDDVREAG